MRAARARLTCTSRSYAASSADPTRSAPYGGRATRPSSREAQLAAGAAVRLDRSRRPALARAGARARRAPHTASGRADDPPRRLGAVRPPGRARARGPPAVLAAALAAGVPRPTGRAGGAGSARRLVLTPPPRAGCAAAARSPARRHTRPGRDALSLRGAAREREGLHPAPAGELDKLGVAAAPRRAAALLAESFNDVAVALARARDAEQAFLLSVSHELKTPLTAIR